MPPDHGPCGAHADLVDRFLGHGHGMLAAEHKPPCLPPQNVVQPAFKTKVDFHDLEGLAALATCERGSGRLVVSYDTGNTAIVWDILTGEGVARFSSYEDMRVAAFLRNGNIAFGNDQGNIILFEPSTSEHISARTIFDPVTALAPSNDCRTFAIGYLNGSILIATLQPSFTILHTLTTNRPPSRITGLAWHGSSSKQKTDMLATQTADGDLRVWSVPKGVNNADAPPNIIRVLQRAEMHRSGTCWFTWSKNGRIVQHAEGETRSWDVRTKKVTYDLIPTVDGVTAIAGYGPTATLFTLGRNHTVQQYDITPNSHPMQVAAVQHVPANTPPTPPTILEEQAGRYGKSRTTHTDTESSADESAHLSPLQKIAKEMDSLDALESEIRDKVMPLSPSSRASSVSSRSSRGSRKGRKYLYDRPDSSRASSTTGPDGTEFSFAEPLKTGRESISIRSVSSYASRPNIRNSNLRKEVMRSPNEMKQTATMELFPCTKARLLEVAFRTPHYGNGARTPELLQREMLSVVFGWNDDIRSLIREEMALHRPGSASGVLLAKWLGDMGADSMASMIGSESMTSSDWMLLALSSIGRDSQKKVGEAFVQRLLEKGDIHPAVAILLGLGEHNDAIEVYVSQGYWLEAVLLTCLTCPADWGRQSYLIRKWGEVAVRGGQAELAVRCFSCTSIETSEPWFSPRAQQDAAYAAQQQRMTEPLSALSAGSMSSPPLSPPSRSGSGRLTAKHASLKLITRFGGEKANADAAAALAKAAAQVGVTPIAESALSPGGWRQQKQSALRDPSSARTATPGGFARRKRLPSKSDIDRAKQEAADFAIPMTAARDFASRAPSRASNTSSVPEPATALKTSTYDANKLGPAMRDDSYLPSPAQGVFDRFNGRAGKREPSHDRKPDGLAVEIIETRYTETLSPALSTGNQGSLYSTATGFSSREAARSPPLTGGSLKTRAINEYISSVEEARSVARHDRTQSRKRGDSRRRDESRGGRGTSRVRDASRGGDNVRLVKPAKRSPSSPVPMSPEEIAQASHAMQHEPATTDDESFYKITSPSDSPKSMRSARSDANSARIAQRERSPDRVLLGRESGRGRSVEKTEGSTARSPSLPLPISPEKYAPKELDETQSDGPRFRTRARSASRRAGEDLQARRAASRNQRDRSSSRRPAPQQESLEMSAQDDSWETLTNDSKSVHTGQRRQPRGLSRKELAAKELEERRMSLARRPSAPAIPLPAELLMSATRPGMVPRSHTELGDSPRSSHPPLSRSQTVDPEAMSRYNGNGRNGAMLPPMGLPATPRAMRVPRDTGAPPVPDIPGNASELSSIGGNLTGSSLSQASSLGPSNVSSILPQSQVSSLYPQSQVSSSLQSAERPADESDEVGSLLPSTVFGQKASQAPARSASAPPEKMMGSRFVHPAYKPNLPSTRRLSVGRGGHVRNISPPEINTGAMGAAPSGISSIAEALHGNDQILIIHDEDEEAQAPIMLPELQHLAGPPPPPPPPTMYTHQSNHSTSEMIDITIDNHLTALPNASPFMLPSTTFGATLPSVAYPAPMERATTASPSLQRHRRGSGSVNETFGARFRGVTERMRSQSRSRAKSPPVPNGGDAFNKAAPYETVLPPMPSQHARRESLSRAKSPYELAMSAGGQDQLMPPPPPPPPAPPAAMDMMFTETAIPPSNLPSSRSGSTTGYRNPKEIRANMPPQTLQQGVYNGGFL
ncbi:hypothetical protein B0A55_03201 [Friedmanniomyces simplex]|uniref:Gem-associated protein 5 TPR domain-containing protein n=1 Tax=Friedmanniomyces simplex TaxID=329884 RepID=A0A4U0XN72_9PEZI|nr:hypothetical protein B0A55_03201 [Friedmanniomyces simplex]